MRRINAILVRVLVLLIALLPVPPQAFAGASDIKLFAGGGRLPPNIMILLDNSYSMLFAPGSGGFTSKKDIAKSALNTLITKVNPSDGAGGYVENARFGLFTFQSYGGMLNQSISSGNTSSVLSAISSHSTVATSVGTPLADATLDIARYFQGSSTAWGSLPKWGTLAGESAVTSPFDYACRDTFLIVISDGDPTFDSMQRTGYWATIGDADGDAGAGEGTVTENASNVTSTNVQWGDDITYAMFRHDFSSSLTGTQNVVTHTIGFDVDTPVLQRMADNGGGKYYRATDATTLAAALNDATTQIFDSLASYSTAVVPTSRTSFGSSFYNAYFEPKSNEAFWEGHVEAYGLSPQGEILDAAGNPAVDSSTNQLIDPHNPYWDAGIELRTQTVRDIYTTLAGARTDFVVTAAIESALGVTAAEVPLYPNYSGSGITTATGVADAVVNYLHGQDAFDEDKDGSKVEMRPKVLGDVFHSTPRIIGAPGTGLMLETGYKSYYNAYVARDRVLYVGANDGMLHGFDAGSLVVGDNPATPETETAYYTPGTGREVFGYVPGLLLDKVKLVPRNSPRTYYFVDGSPVAADVWLPSNSTDVSKDPDEWTTALITGFREGGPGYLALDVTDPTATSTDAHGPYPKLMWEFTDPTLGEAWSEPIIARVKVRDGVTGDFCGPNDGDGDCREHWVAIVGGGYEPAADPNNSGYAATSADSNWTVRSKSILMIDLATGKVLAKVAYNASTNPNMNYALPSTPAVLDLNFDGFADVVYIGDLGGQMWKWDISAVGVDSNSDGVVDNWPAGVFFSTPATLVGASQYHYRSFFFPPAASFVRGRLVLSFATGEREQLDYPGVAAADENNRMYVLWDNNPTGASAFSTSATEADLTDITATSTDNDPSDLGYYFTVPDGEKFVSDVLIFAGYVIAVSFQSSDPDPCVAAVGTSNIYAFKLTNGQGYFTSGALSPMDERSEVIGGGLASTPRVSIAPDPDHDQIYVKTSRGEVLTIEPPPRKESGGSMIYWKQNY